MSEQVQRLVAVVGATATGKSDLAVELARHLNGEVINADAMQLYRGMDIGTAKLPVPERFGVPHHLLDVLSVIDEATLAAYQRDALDAVRRICERGRTPILVGGSGLYLHAVLDDLRIPPTDPAVRAQWEAELTERGAPELHGELARHDPAAAAAILPTNGRRIVRALEVITLTGEPFSANLPQREYRRDSVQIGLRAERELLDQRIEARVDRMLTDGLIEETRVLLDQGLRRGRTASRAIGYAQAISQLDGVLSPEQSRESIITATRRLVRRQESWFRRDDRIHWLDAGSGPGRGLTARALELITL